MRCTCSGVLRAIARRFGPSELLMKLLTVCAIGLQQLGRAMGDFWPKPIIGNCILPVVEVQDLPASGPQAAIQEKRATPFTKRPSGITVFLEAVTDVCFVLDVKLESIADAGFKKHAAVAEISALVAKEPRPLFNGVGIADTHIAGHIRDGESLDGIASVHRLAANENPRIAVLPVGLGGNRPRVYLQHHRMAD